MQYKLQHDLVRENKNGQRIPGLGMGVKNEVVAAPLVPIAQDPYAQLRWVR